MNKLTNSIATATLLSLSAMMGISEMAQAAAIRNVPVFNTNTLARNDDGSTGLVPIGFDVNFFGVMRNAGYVNNNGNFTFDQALATFTPFDLTSTGRQIIAPFFADVDTRSAGEPVRYGNGVINGQRVFGVNYLDVDYFPSSVDHTARNFFQVILTDRSDIAMGDFDIEFNYDQIQWETGGASGGNANGLGGSSARVGYSNGTGAPGTFLELPGSAVNGAFLNGGINALVSGSLNSNVAGRYIFNARNGTILPPTPEPTATPEPAGVIGILALGILGGASKLKKRN